MRSLLPTHLTALTIGLSLIAVEVTQNLLEKLAERRGLSITWPRFL